MKKYILWIGIFVLGAGVGAYAASPTPLCYFSSAGVCTTVTASTPLPVYAP